VTLETLEKHRLRNWRQDGNNNIPDPEAAIDFINLVGICPLYKASSEFPNLFQAYVGDANAKGDSGWDTPSGEVYTWRWKIGKTEKAFYAAIVDKKPTWVSWEMLPTCLASVMERRTPDELFDLGLISVNAHKIATVLDEAEGVLSTKELRKQAGFPTGKENRNAYLKAVGELETFLLLAKKMTLGEDSDDMSHALIPIFYRAQTDQALAMSQEDALRDLISNHIKFAAFVNPTVFAKSLKLPKELVMQTMQSLENLKRLDQEGQVLFYDSNLLVE
jgi:hypothetical protein